MARPDSEGRALVRVEVSPRNLELGLIERHIEAGAAPVQRLRVLATRHQRMRRRRRHTHRVPLAGLHRDEEGAGHELAPVLVVLGPCRGIEPVSGWRAPRQALLVLQELCKSLGVLS